MLAAVLSGNSDDSGALWSRTELVFGKRGPGACLGWNGRRRSIHVRWICYDSINLVSVVVFIAYLKLCVLLGSEVIVLQDCTCLVAICPVRPFIAPLILAA